MNDKINKQSIEEISASSLKKETDESLLNLHRHFHGLWKSKGKDRKSDDIPLEDIFNAHELVVQEMIGRGFVHGSLLSGIKIPEKKSEPLNTSVPQEEDRDNLAPVNPSGNVLGKVIKLEEVLEHIKSFRVRQPFLYLTGGIVNKGETNGDIDFQIKGQIPPGMLKVVQFRLGKMLPKEMSSRVSFLPDDFDGPLTNNIPLGDLLFKVNDIMKTIQMNDPDTYSEEDFVNTEEEMEMDPLYVDSYIEFMSAKKKDLFMIYPESGKLPAALQLHFLGKSVHGDLKFNIGKELIGWTLFWQKPETIKEDINTVKDGEEIFDDFTTDKGNDHLKPILAPSGIQAIKKSPEPLEWMDVEGVIPPGETGSTANQESVYVNIEDPKKYKVEFGVQKPYFHEYFLTNGSKINGTIYFRLLSSEGYARAGDNKFWRTFISKDNLPSVLNERSVETKSMPPDGISAMPVSLMKQTPEEYRFWEQKGEEARKVRDELVKSEYFTKDNVRIIDGQYKRVKLSGQLTVTAPIIKVDKEERMVYGIVLEPNVLDAQGDVIGEEEIRTACHKFMEFHQQLGYQHKEFDKQFRIMECYISPSEITLNNQTIRKGTWMMAVRVLEDDIWEKVKEGEITGFSIGGFGKRTRRKN